MTYQEALLHNRFVQAALVTKLKHPALGRLAQHLCSMDEKRQREKGRKMSDDHLKQEAIKWEKNEG